MPWTKESVARKLREVRGNLSQDALGKKLGKNQVWVSRHEDPNGTDATIWDAEAWTEACGHPFRWVDADVAGALSLLPPDDADLLLRLVRVWDHIGSTRRTIESITGEVEERAAAVRKRATED